MNILGGRLESSLTHLSPAHRLHSPFFLHRFLNIGRTKTLRVVRKAPPSRPRDPVNRWARTGFFFSDRDLLQGGRLHKSSGCRWNNSDGCFISSYVFFYFKIQVQMLRKSYSLPDLNRPRDCLRRGAGFVGETPLIMLLGVETQRHVWWLVVAVPSWEWW